MKFYEKVTPQILLIIFILFIIGCKKEYHSSVNFMCLACHSDIQLGAFASRSPIQFVFFHKGGHTHEVNYNFPDSIGVESFEEKARKIHLIEKKAIPIDKKGRIVFPKDSIIEIIFECRDKENDIYFGDIKVRKKVSVKSSNSAKHLTRFISKNLYNTARKMVLENTIYFDQFPNKGKERIVKGESRFVHDIKLKYDGKRSVTVNLKKYGLFSPYTRIVKVRKGDSEITIDSIPFSTISQADSLMSHEIITINKSLKTIKIERFYNNNQQALEAYFEDREGEKKKDINVFDDIEHDWNLNGGWVEETGHWKVWNHKGKLLYEPRFKQGFKIDEEGKYIPSEKW